MRNAKENRFGAKKTGTPKIDIPSPIYSQAANRQQDE